MIQEIWKPEKAAAYVKSQQKKRQSIIGFAHRVYRSQDTQARDIREDIQKIIAEITEIEDGLDPNNKNIIKIISIKLNLLFIITFIMQ